MVDQEQIMCPMCGFIAMAYAGVAGWFLSKILVANSSCYVNTAIDQYCLIKVIIFSFFALIFFLISIKLSFYEK